MDDKSPKGICPYYKRETAQMIICTGIVPNSDLESGFASVKAKRNHKKRYCEGVYFRCPHACMLNTQWKRYDVVSCKWNKGVECADMSQCDHCGWNPIVAKRRLCEILMQDGTCSKCPACHINSATDDA